MTPTGQPQQTVMGAVGGESPLLPFGRRAPAGGGDPAEAERARERFVGDTGLVFESLHLPRIAGQIFGALLLAPQDGCTAAELGERLQVSKGSVSGMTRLLIHYGMVDRVSLPGDRRDRFVVRPGASAEMMLGRMALLGQLQTLAIEGLQMLPLDADPGPLLEIRDMYEFLQRELPKLVERWESERRGREEREARP